MPTWLLTSTTYGTWLPGDRRGSIASVRERRDKESGSQTRREHDRFGEAYEPPMPELEAASRSLLKPAPIYLTLPQANRLLDQFQQTAAHRSHTIHALSIMSNHFHLVVTPLNDADPAKVLGEFKAYGSRSLNQEFGKPKSGTWWTKRGSTRRLPNESAIAAAVNYVLNKQPNPLLTWSPAQGKQLRLPTSRRRQPAVVRAWYCTAG